MSKEHWENYEKQMSEKDKLNLSLHQEFAKVFKECIEVHFPKPPSSDEDRKRFRYLSSALKRKFILEKTKKFMREKNEMGLEILLEEPWIF